MKKFSIAAIILLMAAVGFVTTAQAEITVPPVDTEMTAVKPGGAAVYTPPPALQPQVSALKSYLASLDEKMDKSLKNQAYIGAKVRESIRKIDTQGKTLSSVTKAVDDLGANFGTYAEKTERVIKANTAALKENAGALNAAEAAILSLEYDKITLEAEKQSLADILKKYQYGVVCAVLLVLAAAIGYTFWKKKS